MKDKNKLFELTPPDHDPINWHQVVNDVRENKTEIKNLKARDDGTKKVISAMKQEIEQVKTEQGVIIGNIKDLKDNLDGFVKKFTSIFDSMGKGIVRFRYWLVGTIVTCTIATMSIWYGQKSNFEQDIKTEITKLETKIEKSNDRMYELVKELKKQ